MTTLTSADLAPFVNNYTITKGPPKTIVVGGISKMDIASLQNITVNGTLLNKQFVRLDPETNERHIVSPAGGGKYSAEAGDGDLHFCLGTENGGPHIACELQNAKAWVSTFNQSIGNPISVSGYFRCMFEHPGFRSNDDAHIFEIHPVRAVDIDGHIQAFDVDVPKQDAIHTWTDPHPLNEQDSRITVQYDNASDTLTFSDMVGQDENYVQVTGKISQINLNDNTDLPASFRFDSPDIGHTLQAYCLQGTTATSQLSQLRENTNVSMVTLRNIDLKEALQNRYIISLLAIDISPF